LVPPRLKYSLTVRPLIVPFIESVMLFDESVMMSVIFHAMGLELQASAADSFIVMISGPEPGAAPILQAALPFKPLLVLL